MKSLTKIHRDIDRAIARSHAYWGRKPFADLFNIFEELNEGDIVLDPFCGGGNPAIAALIRGGRVIACDLNPMAVFLTNVLIRPINLATLKSAFEDVSAMVSRNILDKYKIRCPNCKKMAVIRSLVWVENTKENRPETAQIECAKCGSSLHIELSSIQVKRQLRLSQMHPEFWYPNNRIHSTRKPPVRYHYELFTGRNLSMLAELLHAIKKVPSESLRDALLYVFTAMLYSCSSMQMFSEKEPSSSRGWTALRFYIPPKRQEANVWLAFENRFESLIRCKGKLNHYMPLPSVRIAHSEKEFFSKKYEALIYKADAHNAIRQFGEKANFVFLDPPYIEDIDYFGFSEFWGAWLQMDFDFDREWHPKKINIERLKKLLVMLSDVTACDIGLAFAPKRKDWDVTAIIKESKYNIKRTGYFNYDNSNKRGEITDKSNRYFILTKEPAPIFYKEPAPSKKTDNISQIYPYLRAISFLHLSKDNQNGPLREKRVHEQLRTRAYQLVPNKLQRLLRVISDNAIEKEISDVERNKRTYHSLCYSLIRIIISKDGWKIEYLDPSQVERNIFGISRSKLGRMKTKMADGVAFIAKKDNHRMFFFFDDQEKPLLKRVATEIKDSDKNEFKNICVMILPDAEKMKKMREIDKADGWPRGFFMCFPEIQRRCEKVNKEEYLKLCARFPTTRSDLKMERSSIMSLTAQVNSNIPVGEDSPNHYKLRFETTRSFNIIPGQFIMTATTPRRGNKALAPIKWDKLKSSFRIEPKSYLKRPFGIHRAYYPYFDKYYLKKLSLPPTLATVLHTVFPHEFDIFYKVLASGVGTKELSNVKRGDKLQIIGPLGNGLNMREIRTQGFEEVHVIGGGVGMAPLIFMVQALRYYSYKIKAFIGIEKIGRLKYSYAVDGLEQTFEEDPKDATIYIDDLIEAGIEPADIYLSSGSAEYIESLPKRNVYTGLVSDQYKDYLSSSSSKARIVAFTCGPMGMMKGLAQITKKHQIPLKVLMEKRMACGIGVCLSCVCETKNGETTYSRVCTDGPIFDASEISWENIY